MGGTQKGSSRMKGIIGDDTFQKPASPGDSDGELLLR